MQKNINISYLRSAKASAQSISLNYKTELAGNIHTIYCTVSANNNAFPDWLQLRKFDIESIFDNGSYTLLYKDDNVKNLDTALFIDQAYAEIMVKEQVAS